MATVPYRLESQEDFDNQDSVYQDPLALVDSPYSDAARAEADSKCIAVEDIPQAEVPRQRSRNTKTKNS